MDISTPFEAGDKIQYCLFDKKGKEHWINGAIHGVKRAEDPATNMIISVTYLVDTGRNDPDYTYTNVYNKRHKAYDAHVRKLLPISDELPTEKELADAIKQADKLDLPKDEIVEELVRQPEQIELPANLIRPRQ